MRRLLSLRAAVLLLFCLPAAAEGGVLVPREVFVADEAELAFETAALAGVAEAGAVLTVPAADLPVSDDLTVKSIQARITDSGAQVTVRFVPWISGLLQIPSFSVLNVRITPPPARIGSLVEKTGRTALEDARSPLLLPGTTYALYGLVAVFLAACGIAVAAAVRIRKFLSFALGKNQAGRRVSLALKQLRALERQIKKTGCPEWYRVFAAALRTYLGSLASGDSGRFAASTATEIVSVLDEELGVAAEFPADRLGGLLHRIDTIRYSGYPAEDTRAQDAAEARLLVGLLEAARLSASSAAPEVIDVQL